MKRILLCITFDGSGYRGWQAQADADGRTVQQRLCKAAAKVFCRQVDISGCGRTDSGVHANRFYCHMDIDPAFPTERIANALNTGLYRANDRIAVIEAKEAESGFHSRYDIKSKEYMYLIQNDKYMSPLYYNRAYFYHNSLNLAQMRSAAQLLTGEYNFSSFMADRSKIPKEEAVRRIDYIKIDGPDMTSGGGPNLIRIYISANGFLYKMARIITGTLIEVNEGKIQISDLPDIIAKQDRIYAGFTAPAHGLYLNNVEY